MFTGLIEEKGIVASRVKTGACVRLEITCRKVLDSVKIGDSICVSGVCLTVAAISRNSLCFDVMPETFNATTLKHAKIGDEVNLERALKAGDRFGGHFVLGHVDCVGVIRSRRLLRGNLDFLIGLPASFFKYVVRKGSVAIDGISLTIVDVKSGSFSVCIIPHTAKETILGAKHSGDKVNIELDILLKKR